MEIANVVRMRVKPGFAKEFLDTQAKAQSHSWPGLIGAYIVQTGENDFCFVGEWSSMEAIVAMRPAMIAELGHLALILALLVALVFAGPHTVEHYLVTIHCAGVAAPSSVRGIRFACQAT